MNILPLHSNDKKNKMTKYISTKTYKEIAPVAYRQWKDEGNCRLVHGYALTFHFEFECDDLDARNWCVDFGGLRPLKDLLEEWFDHKLLVAQDDPHFDTLIKLRDLGIADVTVVEKTGCEGLADFLYNYVNEFFLKDYGWGDRVWCCKVEVRENEKNSAMRVGHREDLQQPPVVTFVPPTTSATLADDKVVYHTEAN